MGSAQFCPSLHHHHRESVSSASFKVKKDEKGREREEEPRQLKQGSTYVCIFIFIFYDFMNKRIKRIPGHVSIQIYTPTLILAYVSYATTEPHHCRMAAIK